MRSALALLLLVSLSACSSSPEPTPTPRSSRNTAGGERPTTFSRGVSRTLGGAITEQDPLFDDRGARHDRYSVRLDAGDLLEVVMWSAELDTYLLLLGPDGQVVAEDDDGMGTLDSLLRAEAVEAGLYTVIATTYEAGATGTYALSIRSGATAEEVPVALNAGGYDEDYESYPEYERLLELYETATTDRTIAGELTVSSPSDAGEYPRFYEDHPLDLTAGETLYVRMTAEFDTYLSLLDASGEVVAENDDFEGLNSFLVVEVPASGTYTIRATTFGSEVTGRYELGIGSRPTEPSSAE